MGSSSSSSLPSSLSSSGDHWATNASVSESIRRTPSSTTWRSKSNFPTVRFPANRVDLEELNPGIVTSARAPPPSPYSSSPSSSSNSISLFSSPAAPPPPSSLSSISATSLTLCTPNTLVSLTKLWTRNESSMSSNFRRRFHMPTIPPISTAACSRIPTPFRTRRTVPSFPTPEHVTTMLCRCLPPPIPLDDPAGRPPVPPAAPDDDDGSGWSLASPQGLRSKSTMGPRLSYSSSTSTYVVSANGPPADPPPSSSSASPLVVPAATVVIDDATTTTGESSILTS